MLISPFSEKAVKRGVEAATRLMIQEKYDDTQFPLLPLPEEGVALTLDTLIYKEYYATRKSHYLTMFPMKEGM